MVSQTCTDAIEILGPAWHTSDEKQRAVLFAAFHAGYVGAEQPEEGKPAEINAAIQFGICYQDPAQQEELMRLLMESAQGSGVETDTIRTNGIVLTFPQKVRAAQYASGDWAVGIPCPRPTVSGNVSGAMWNPICGPRQGLLKDVSYSATIKLAYNSELNVLGSLPATISQKGPLVLAVPIPPPTVRVNLDSVAILTFTDKLPSYNELRPPYTRADPTRLGARPERVLVPDDSVLNRLPKLAVKGPGAFQIASKLKGPWCPDFYPNFSGSALFPAKQMPNYGRDLAVVCGAAMAFLLCDETLEDKRTVATHLCQWGLDSLGIKTSVGFDEDEHWLTGGAHALGRRGALAALQHLCGVPALGTESHIESHDIFYVDQEVILKGQGYSQADLGMPEWAQQYDRRNWSLVKKDWWADPYRRVVGCCLWGYAAFCEALDPTRNLLAPKYFLDYVHRFEKIQGDAVSSGSQSMSSLAYGELGEYARNVWLWATK